MIITDDVTVAAQRIRVLEEEYRQLSQTNQSFHEAITQVRASLGLPVNLLLLSLILDFLYLLFNVLQPGPELTRSPLTWARSPPDSEQLAAAPYPTPVEMTAPSPVDSSDTNNTKVGLDDPTSKVLPAALRKNKIKEEDWGDYAMFITYGPVGNGIFLKVLIVADHIPQEIESNDAWSLMKDLYICSKS